MSWQNKLLAGLIATGLLTGHPTAVRSDDAVPTGAPGAEVAELKDQLEKGLKARRPEEFAMVARIVSLVERGELPLGMVRSTFIYIRKQRKYEKILFPYFEQALRVRAKEIGITF